MIPREISGPQERFERRGEQALRDIRPLSVRLSRWLRSEASGMVLGGMAGTTLLAPAVFDVTLAAGLFYAAWVLTARVEAPIRLPRSARRRDWSDPDPKTRKPRRSWADIFIGWCALTGKQIWINNEDQRQHGTIPGTTGSGKTTTIMSSNANPLTHGSGFCVVDGKANSELYGQAYVLVRSFGREDDLRVLNLLTASQPAEALAHGYNPLKQTNSFNPFATGNADALHELLVSQLGEAPSNDTNGVFRDRAVALIGTLAPVLVWMRDHRGISINIEKIRFMVELKSIWMLAKHKVFRVRDPDTNVVSEIEVPDMPADLIYPLEAYLGEIPGYDTSLPYNAQKSDEPSKQHGFAIFYFSKTFTQLAVSLGHIFKVETGDIDMRDIVMNRRVLLVNLPALQGSDATLAALGRIVVASMRAMMAQLLGAKLEGDPREIFAHKPGMGGGVEGSVGVSRWNDAVGVGAFCVDFDEIGYYATAGMDRMLAMGRGINMAFRIAMQELGGIHASLGEKMYSLLGNANLTLAMRQQDSGRTWEWLQKTAGQTWVTQATSYQGGLDGAYREGHTADLRQVNRVDWQDFQNLLQGEAIVMLGGRRIYARLAHFPLEITGRPRLCRTLMLEPPKLVWMQAPLDRVTRVRERIKTGLRSDAPDAPVAGVLDALVTMLASQAAAGAATQDSIAAAFRAVGQLVEAQACVAKDKTAPGSPPADGAAPDEDDDGDEDAEDEAFLKNEFERQPVTEFTPMLDVTATARPLDAGPARRPQEPVDAELLSRLIAIEVAAGASKPMARASAQAALGERDAALAAITLPVPPPMPAAELHDRLERLAAQLAVLGLAMKPEEGQPEGLRDAAE